MDLEAETSDGFSEWVQIEGPTSSTDPPPVTPSKGHDDMVTSTENNNTESTQHQQDLSVFSPSRNEGVETTSDEELGENSSVTSLLSTTAPGDEANNSGSFKKVNEIGKILSNGIVKVGVRVRYLTAFPWGVWSVKAIGGVLATMFLSLVYAKLRNWRARVKEEKIKHPYMFLIQETDQKINQLLAQIAYMNELLSARRRVPVLRIS